MLDKSIAPFKLLMHHLMCRVLSHILVSHKSLFINASSCGACDACNVCDGCTFLSVVPVMAIDFMGCVYEM